MLYIKFLYWKGDTAYFRKAKMWEIIRMKFRGIFTTKPDPNNLIIRDYFGDFKFGGDNNGFV